MKFMQAKFIVLRRTLFELLKGDASAGITVPFQASIGVKRDAESRSDLKLAYI